MTRSVMPTSLGAVVMLLCSMMMARGVQAQNDTTISPSIVAEIEFLTIENTVLVIVLAVVGILLVLGTIIFVAYRFSNRCPIIVRHSGSRVRVGSEPSTDQEEEGRGRPG